MMAQEQKISIKQVGYYTDYNVTLPDLCSELSFFVIFDFPHHQKQQNIHNSSPIVVTYRNQEITFKEILQRFHKMNKNTNKRQNLKFTLSKGYRIHMSCSVLDLKKNLRQSNLDGIVLFTSQSHQESESDSDQQIDFQNQCGLMEFIGIQNQFDREKKFTYHFLLPKSKYVISIKINPTNKVKELIELFMSEIVKQFKIYLQKQDIQQFRIKDTKICLQSKDTIANVKNLYDDTQIYVVLLNHSIHFQKKSQDQNFITIFKEFVSSKTQKTQVRKIMVNYAEIKNMQIKMINQQYFLEKGEKQNKNNPICLKVMELILKGQQKLNKLQYAIKKLKELGEVKLVGYLINQKMVFYKQIPQILKIKDAKQFTLAQLQIPHQQKKQRSKCDQLINERLVSIQEAYFQNKQHIEPIFIYTSNLKYKDKKTGKINKIYDALNWCLRNQSVLLKSAIQICQEWIFRYTSTLLRHLQQIGGERCKVYRGVNYDPQGKIGDLITFKPFTSTSKAIKVAMQFALQRYTQDQNLPLTIFQMQILEGKPIDKLSYYSTEQQILLQPFTEFVITAIQHDTKMTFPPDFVGAHQYNFTIYKLKEIPSSKQIPKTTNNYIIWVDSNLSQAKQTFNKFIQEFHHPTVLFQIASTLKLKEWIKQRQNIINDSSSKIIMVTNMVRTEEDNVRNFYAGVDSINLIREYLPDIPIAVYVRDTKACQNNLNEKNVNRNHLEVISQFQDFTKFVQTHIHVKFRSIFPKQITSPSSHLKHSISTEHTISFPKTNLQKKSKSQVQKNDKGKCNIM